MNQILCCDWLPKLEDGAILPAQDYRLVLKETVPPKPYNKLILYLPNMFGQDDWILAVFFSCEFMDLDSLSVLKQSKKELGQYSSWPHTSSITHI